MNVGRNEFDEDIGPKSWNSRENDLLELKAILLDKLLSKTKDNGS